MKVFLLSIILSAGANCFASTGWTTYVTNNSNSELILTSSSVLDETWTLGDLSYTLLIPAHSTRTFYTEETVNTNGFWIKALTFSANYAQLYTPIVYQATINANYNPNISSSQKETPLVLVNRDPFTPNSSGEYGFEHGCVTVAMSLSESNQLGIEHINYGDNGDCSANLGLRGQKQKMPPKAIYVTYLPAPLHVYQNEKNNYEAQMKQNFKLNRNEAIRVMASLQDPEYKAYELYLQSDDNLLEYGCADSACTRGVILWTSGSSLSETGVNPDSYMIFQKSDGNLVVRNGAQALWASGTDNKNAAKLALQNDGNLVIYNESDKPIWDRISGLLVH